MAINYPLTLPTVTGVRSIELQASNAVAISRSPFTFASQVHAYSGQMWSASLTLPPMKLTEARQWTAWLTSLRGQYGSFLLGDTSSSQISGTATSVSVTGVAGDNTVTVTSNGTILAGDMIQIGPDSDATLHKVLADQSGNGSLEIWPAIRKDRAAVAVTLTNAKGAFRLASNEVSWSVDEASIYGISFSAVEKI
jgi:hypothetical protein